MPFAAHEAVVALVRHFLHLTDTDARVLVAFTVAGALMYAFTWMRTLLRLLFKGLFAAIVIAVVCSYVPAIAASPIFRQFTTLYAEFLRNNTPTTEAAPPSMSSSSSSWWPSG